MNSVQTDIGRDGFFSEKVLILVQAQILSSFDFFKSSVLFFVIGRRTPLTNSKSIKVTKNVIDL